MKFKLKKIPLIYKEQNIIILIIFLFVVYILIYPVYFKKEPKFEGNITSNKYINENTRETIYENNGKIESHFIDTKEKEEIDFYTFIKEEMIDEFNTKIWELLTYKYPSKIVNNLKNPQYTFETDFLKIYYNLNNKIYTLDVDYDYIKDYLNVNVTYDNALTYESGYNYDSNKVSIVLTFDDGPNGDKTKAIIDVLEDYKMSATFFIIGNKIQDNVDTIKYIDESHSEMGYHSFSHIQFTKQNKKTIIDDYNISDDYYFDITGKHFNLVRPPYGSYNASVLKILDMPFIRWNIDTNDWKYKDVDHIVNEVMENYNEGTIILCHDSYDTTVEAVKIFIDKLYDANVQVLSVSDYVKLKNINLNNQEVYFYF